MATVLNTIMGRTAKGRKGKKGEKPIVRKVLNTILGRTVKRRKGKKSAKASVTPTSWPSPSPSTKMDTVDVREPADIEKLTDLLKKNKIVIVLVYADWCGHCQTFKQDIWSKLTTLPNRKVPLAAVNETMLKKTPLAKTPVDGYPTVLMMGNDGKPATFKDEQTGEPTVAMPNTRDLANMTRIVTKDPTKVLSASGAEAEPTSAESTEAAEEALNEKGEDIVNALNNGLTLPPPTPVRTEMTTTPPNPPDVEDDLLKSQESGQPLNSKGNVMASGAAAGNSVLQGGSLYQAMLEAAGMLAVPAALAGSAVYLDRRAKSQKRARKAARTRRRRLTAKKLMTPPASGAV